MNDLVVEATGIRRWYGEGEARVEVLKGVDLAVRRGEYVAIMGSSGSGKSTLLAILGCLDRPGEGGYRLDGVDVLHLSDDRISALRLSKIGFNSVSVDSSPTMQRRKPTCLAEHRTFRRTLSCWRWHCGPSTNCPKSYGRGA